VGEFFGRAVVPDEFVGRVAQAAGVDGFAGESGTELSGKSEEFGEFEHCVPLFCRKYP
jgi:hypothetical protein